MCDLTGYIALRINKDDVSPSGLFINDVNGISLKRLENIANSEQVNFKGVWDDIEKRALSKFWIKARGTIASNFSIADPVVINCIVCKYKDAYKVALQFLLATEVMIETASSERINYFTTVDEDKAEQLRDEYYEEFKEAFADANLCLNIEASGCLPLPACVHRNITYSTKRSRL